MQGSVLVRNGDFEPNVKTDLDRRLSTTSKRRFTGGWQISHSQCRVVLDTLVCKKQQRRQSLLVSCWRYLLLDRQTGPKCLDFRAAHVFRVLPVMKE